ncbi:hypothetical protein [Sphingobacterium sp. CZ-2]|uniref:hypothetical protein n=1 Tax=Sphingobacterium sp. CZ-2 TaxID=2557994 RepID=UPI00142F9F87|nr:hypothetical protein [Sphingobacterium sp. CZ-2]
MLFGLPSNLPPEFKGLAETILYHPRTVSGVAPCSCKRSLEDRPEFWDLPTESNFFSHKLLYSPKKRILA